MPPIGIAVFAVFLFGPVISAVVGRARCRQRRCQLGSHGARGGAVLGAGAIMQRCRHGRVRGRHVRPHAPRVGRAHRQGDLARRVHVTNGQLGIKGRFGFKFVQNREG